MSKGRGEKGSERGTRGRKHRRENKKRKTKGIIRQRNIGRYRVYGKFGGI